MVTFVWSVEEETGLSGSTLAAKTLQDASIIYPVGTYVSFGTTQVQSARIGI